MSNRFRAQALAVPVLSLILLSTAAAAEHGSVVIKRDDYGIPNIYSDSIYGLFYGFGYALAEDRLFQIESERRTVEGRAAEVFGPEYLSKDTAMLTNYDSEGLKEQLSKLTGEHRDVFDGMTDGINARIAEVLDDPEHLEPKEFSYYDFDPQPWTDLDIAMSWMGQYLLGFADYTSQISNQVFLADLTKAHGDKVAQQIFNSLRWKSDPTAPTTVPNNNRKDEGPATIGEQSRRNALTPISALAARTQAEQSILLWNGVGPDMTPHASNVWLVNGSKLSDADAILYNGPQVGDYVPSRIWSASLHGAGLDVTGSTYPGLPYFHYGTNGDIAWGRTALAGSIIDIFEETLNPDDPHQYRYNGKWVEMQKRTRTVRVKGREPVVLELYSTVHGPVVLFDEENHRAYSKKRSWAGHELETIIAYYEEMKARNWEQWRAQIASKSNNQNQYYADRRGNIGYIQAGRYPIRAKGHNIQLPTSGTGDMEWQGIQPFEDHAHIFNPEQGYLANWNNRPSADIANTDTLLWSKLDHVDAIFERLESKPALTTREVWDINRWTSFATEQYRYFAPLIRDAVRSTPPDSRLRAVADALLDWNGQQVDPSHSGVYSSPAIAIYYEWLSAALNEFYGDVLPEKYLTGCGVRWQSYNCPYGQPDSAVVLYFALADGETGSPVPEYDFLKGRDRDAFILEALEEADRKLTEKYGQNIATWLADVRPKTWHTDGPLGDPWTIPDQQMQWSPNQKRGTMSLMFVFRNGKVSMCDVIPPGQSGFLAPDGREGDHYADQLQLYTGFNCKARRVTDEEVDANTTSVDRLTF